MANVYHVGDRPELEWEVRVDDELVDPVTVEFSIRSPTGVYLLGHFPAAGGDTITLTHPGTGRFVAKPLFDESGAWNYRWESTSPDAAREIPVQVLLTQVPTPATPAEPPAPPADISGPTGPDGEEHEGNLDA